MNDIHEHADHIGGVSQNPVGLASGKESLGSNFLVLHVIDFDEVIQGREGIFGKEIEPASFNQGLTVDIIHVPVVLSDSQKFGCTGGDQPASRRGTDTLGLFLHTQDDGVNPGQRPDPARLVRIGFQGLAGRKKIPLQCLCLG